MATTVTDSNTDTSSTAAANESRRSLENHPRSSPRSRREEGGGGSKPILEEEEEEIGNADGRRMPPWARLSNGTASPLIIAGESWPALSESVRVPSLKPNPDSYKALSDDSSLPLLSSAAAPRCQVTPPPVSHNQRPSNFNADPNSTPNHTLPSGQKSMKHNGSNVSAGANGGNAQQPGPQGPLRGAYSNSSSPRDQAQRSSQSRSVSDHPQLLRNSFRNRNGGPHSRGDGSHGYRGRRDHDRSNPDWNSRNFRGRDANMQLQRGVPSFMRHAPPPTASYISPRAFGNPFGYPEFPFYSYGPPPDHLRGMHLYPGTAAPFYVLLADPHLLSKILNQIDYYFSDENLVKDIFLRQNMDEQGWVPIKLIAGFNRVLHLTDNIQVILDALRSSLVVEVQGDRVRRRNDWMRWTIPSAVRSPNVSSVQSYGNSSHDRLTENIHRMSLEEQVISQNNVMGQADARSEVILGRSFSGNLNNQLQPSMNEETEPYSHPGDSSYSISARN